MLFRRYYCYLPPQASLSSSEDEHFTSTSYALPKASLGSQRVHYYGRQERIYDNVFEDEFSRDVETSRLRTSGAMFPVTSPGCRYFHHPSFEAPKRVALSRSCSQSSGRSQPVYAQRHPEQVTHGSNGNAPIRRISMIYATPPTQKFAHSMPGRFPVSAQDYWHANANKQTQSYVQKAPSYGGSIGHGVRTAAPNAITGITSMGAVAHNVGNNHMVQHLATSSNFSPVSTTSRKKDKKSGKKDKKPRIRKEDISNPTNFQHKAHIGWNQDGGFSQKVFDKEAIDDSVKDMLRAAGHNPDQMCKEDLEFASNFVSNYERTMVGDNGPSWGSPSMTTNNSSSSIGGHMSSGYASSHQSGYNQPKMGMTAAPPPPPARQPAPARPTPPRPPPMSSGAPTRPPPARPLPQPVTTSYRPNDNPPPPPPPSMSMSHGAPPPPPPPPPPPMMGAGAPPPPPPPPPPSGAPSGRANLLQQIQAGTTLKPVTNGGSNGGAPVASNPRDDVMAQIRQGNAQLKHVDPTDVENRKSSNSLQDMGGIAGALARALEERRKNMRDSSDSEDDDERDDSEWEDE